MNELLKILLSLSISASLLILFLFLCKPVFKEKISKQWQYYIWLIVIARLLLPFAPETNLVGNIFQQIDTSLSQLKLNLPPEQDNVNTDFVENEVSLDSQADTAGDRQSNTNISVVVNIFDTIIQNIWLIWLVVAVALFIRKITIYQSFAKYIEAGKTVVSDIEIWEQVGKLVDKAGIKKSVSLYTNDLISSPLLIGFFRPCIILPTAKLSNLDFEYTILHELTHYKRWDMFYKWLVQFAICLHWFNPLVYIMEREINRACELSCDEAVIKNLDETGQQAYGDTLLNAVGLGGNYKNSVASITLYESRELLKERLDAIMNYKKQSKIAVAITLVATIAFASGAATVGAYTVMPQKSSENIKYNMTNANTSDNIQQQLAVSNSGILPDNTKELHISFDINNGGVEILPATSNEIEASYDSAYYDVEITNKNDKWIINISGKVAMMGKTEFVQLHIPDTKRTIDVNVLNGNFSYALPENCLDTISITAKNAGIDFTSKNQYKNSAISLNAINKDFLKYEPPVYPNYFTKTNTGFEYKNGTETNKIDISLIGYTSVNFEESSTSNLLYEIDSSGKIKIPVNISSLSSDLEICIGEIPDIQNAKLIRYDIQGESGGSLFVGISPENNIGTKHFWVGSVESATRNIVWDSGKSVCYSKKYTGNYYVYIQSKYADCSNIKGSIVIEYNQ